jgi:hypothetical protein
LPGGSANAGDGIDHIKKGAHGGNTVSPVSSGEGGI